MPIILCSLIYHLIINLYFDSNYKDSNPSHLDSSDRSPSKLSGRHWQSETALSTTSSSNLSQQRAQCTNIHHDNCCYPLDKKSPVPVNHGRPSKSNVGDTYPNSNTDIIFQWQIQDFPDTRVSTLEGLTKFSLKTA